MDYLKNLSKALYYHRFIRYLLIGGTTFVIDFGLLFFLRSSVHASLVIATSVGYWVAIFYNFILNRWWSFGAAEKNSLHRHAIAYGVLLAFNYIFTVAFVAIVSKDIYFGIAKALAVIIQMSWTYLVYKNYIFVKKAQQSTT